MVSGANNNASEIDYGYENGDNNGDAVNGVVLGPVPHEMEIVPPQPTSSSNSSNNNRANSTRPPTTTTTTTSHYLFPRRPTRRSGFKGRRTISSSQEGQEQQQQQQQTIIHPNGTYKTVKEEQQQEEESSSLALHTTESSSTATAAHNFVLQSIRRGSQEWRALVKPFVADLAFLCVQSRPLAREPLFRPYTCQAAVLFVDLSGYSQVATLLQNRGAHTLSTAVNSYLSRLLRFVQQYGGDVVKFAGDAVLCLWHSQPVADNNDKQGNEKNLARNCLAAALCATQMQKQAGTHPVEGIGKQGQAGGGVANRQHVFRIHIGLCCGTVESEIFVAQASHVNMQRMYHLVGGEAMAEIGKLVDLAKAGQVCVSGKVRQYLEQYKQQQREKGESSTGIAIQAKYSEVPGYRYQKYDDDDNSIECDEEEEDCCGPPMLLTDLAVEYSVQDELEMFIEDTMISRMTCRNRFMEEEFIHPAVLDLLSHGGLSPTQIAQMRDLVVLFIAQTSHTSPSNWLIEVQAILDRNQCPLLQIVDDDKGVHAIAAVNAVASVPESRLLGLEICRQLVRQQIGVAIGMAAGSTFCGVTGSSSVACRWDIVGSPAVRAARLMQFAIAKDVPMAIDESVSVGPTVPAQLTVLDDDVPIKGSPEPIRVFTLSEATEFAAMNLLETVHGEMHNDQTNAITKHILGSRHRSAVVVTGPTLSGKKIVCQRAAGFANMVPFLHVSDTSYGLLQLVRTIAKWFKYVDNQRVHTQAKVVLDLMDQGLFSRAHDECLCLVDDAMEAGLVACFVIDRVEFLDAFSICFIRECLFNRKYRQAASRTPKLGLHRHLFMESDSNLSLGGSPSEGRIAFLCVHVPLYNSPSAQSVVEDITRNHRKLYVPVVEVNEATQQQFLELTDSMTGAEFSSRLIYAATAAAGHCAGYFIERSAAIGLMQPGRIKRGLPPVIITGEDLTVTIPPGALREYRSLSVMQVGPEIAMRYAHAYDELPPIMQVCCKVLAVVSQTTFYWAPRARVWEVMNDIISEGVTDEVMATVLQQMSEMYCVRVWEENGVEYVKLQSPAMADIAMDVCTPVQVESISKAWIGRLDADKDTDFRVPLVLAWLTYMIDPCQKCKTKCALSASFWREGYHAMLKTGKTENWSSSRIDRWKEVIAAEITAAENNIHEVLGDDFSYGGVATKPIDIKFLRVWLYRGPIGLGPLGNTMSILGQLLVNELRLIFHGDVVQDRRELERHYATALERYVIEVEIVEELLNKYNLGTQTTELQAEKEFVKKLANPAADKYQVFEKSKDFIDVLVKNYAEPRVERFRALVSEFDQAPVPLFVSNCACDAVRTAYKLMFTECCGGLSQANEVDSAQHALMILATRGWEPRETPEPMRHLVRQSVARLRNAVVRKLNEGQIHYSRHQQSAIDLKAFLLTTALLFDAQDTGRYS